MLIDNGNGTFEAGELDVLCILHDENTGKYHAAFFEEHPMPGEIKPIEETNLVRLLSKMHHTEGSTTLEGAIKHLNDLATMINVPKENIWRDPMEWNGEKGITIFKKNWRMKK
jgi:hypothetical protein